MRRLIAAATTLVLLFALLLVVPALREPSRQLAAQAPPPLALDVDAAARRLGAAVRARTVSYLSLIHI